jgi:hypothetical protein
VATPSRKQNSAQHPTEPLPKLAFSVGEFCSAVGLSISSYAKMRRRGDGPVEARAWAGSAKIIITRKAADDWITERAKRAAEERAQADEGSR